MLVNANKKLIKIFEQKIKNRIAKVWGTSAPLSTGTSTSSAQKDKKEEKQVLSSSAEQSRSMAAEPVIE